MRDQDTLLNGITLSRVTNARIATSLRPSLTTGFGEHHFGIGLGSRTEPILRPLRVSGLCGRGEAA
jgi:hypothetical protein